MQEGESMIYKLKDICIKVTDGSHFSPKAQEEGYPMFSVKDMLEYGFNYTSCKRISKQDFEKMQSSGCVPQEGDVLVAKDGSYLKEIFVCTETKNEAILSSIAIFRPNQEIVNPYYLCYLLKSPQIYNYIASNCVSGSALPRIVLKDFKEVEMEVPDMSTQTKIVNILKNIDYKIQNNYKINRNLQEQVQAFFSRLYCNATDQSKYKSLIKVLGGGTPKTGVESYWNGTIPFFTPKDVGSPYTFETEKNITEDGLAHCNSKLYPANTTFVTARGTVGKVALAGVPMAMNQSCYALISDILPPLMIYFYTLEVVKALKHKANGAVFDAIVTKDFDTEIINVLEQEDQIAFLDFAEPAYKQIYENIVENQRLQTLRNSLLPKLMTGQLDISEIEI